MGHDRRSDGTLAVEEDEAALPPNGRTPAVVLLSGGLDSSVLLFWVAEQRPVTALTVDYGQRHQVEIEAAHRVATVAGVPHVVCDAHSALRAVFDGAQSTQVGERLTVPEGHYAAPEMMATIIPNRNMMLLSIAGALAVSRGAGVVAYAAHAGDHAVYPDCRPDFMKAVGEALWLGSGLRLVSPFANFSKAEVVHAGEELGVPFGLTYSCYKGRTTQCGRCSTCVERREAFALAETPDPTEYEDTTDFWKTAVGR